MAVNWFNQNQTNLKQVYARNNLQPKYLDKEKHSKQAILNNYT